MNEDFNSQGDVSIKSMKYIINRGREIKSLEERRKIINDSVIKIEPDDISQGGLGVCYFLCSLSSLAENGKYVIKCFNTDKVNNHGVYSVNFYILGYK